LKQNKCDEEEAFARVEVFVGIFELHDDVLASHGFTFGCSEVCVWYWERSSENKLYTRSYERANNSQVGK
jgi:hypothetical protein